MSKRIQQTDSAKQPKPFMFEVDNFYHLLPIVNLARLAILAEKTVKDVDFVADAMPAVGETLRSAGIYTSDEESLAEDAAKSLAFVAYVLQARHEHDMEGGNSGT